MGLREVLFAPLEAAPELMWLHVSRGRLGIKNGPRKDTIPPLPQQRGKGAKEVSLASTASKSAVLASGGRQAAAISKLASLAPCGVGEPQHFTHLAQSVQGHLAHSQQYLACPIQARACLPYMVFTALSPLSS